MKRILCALAAAGAFAPFTAVQAITYNYDAGILHETSAFASFNTTGAEMVGTGVHVEYSDGSAYDTSLLLFSAGNGRVDTPNLFLNIGNTGTTAFTWLLSNPSATLGIRSVSLDGQPGNTVFDVSFPFGVFAGFGFVGTPGTAGGREFNLGSVYRTLYDGITITYSDAVALTGTAPVGDVFRRMKIEFSPTTLLGPRALIEFNQDTDSLAFGSVLAPATGAAVPESGPTITLLTVGLAGLVACARRRAAPSCPV